MINVFIIMVCIVVCSYILSNANIKITITHKHVVDAPAQMVDVDTAQSNLDEAYAKDNTPSFDDIIAEIQSVIGGDIDAN